MQIVEASDSEDEAAHSAGIFVATRSGGMGVYSVQGSTH